ncbi:hypothetical protein LCGC14_2864150 [marine sediment metagenome]|uniref:Uncharacterized protein n=1 Tax=marine sediment metagenome TaxID=412755 RepID=A0A0F8Y4R7_9ZZZZ
MEEHEKKALMEDFIENHEINLLDYLCRHPVGTDLADVIWVRHLGAGLPTLDLLTAIHQESDRFIVRWDNILMRIEVQPGLYKGDPQKVALITITNAGREEFESLLAAADEQDTEDNIKRFNIQIIKGMRCIRSRAWLCTKKIWKIFKWWIVFAVAVLGVYGILVGTEIVAKSPITMEFHRPVTFTIK